MKIPSHNLDKDPVASSTDYALIMDEKPTHFSSRAVSSDRHAASSVFDVAIYILQKYGPTTTMKLQKLVYYAQAWHLVWEDATLFDEKIEAWFMGPVVPELYNAHKGLFKISQKDLTVGDSKKLAKEEKESIDLVIEHYGKYSAYQLSEFTHRELPWRNAREGYDDNERCTEEITPAAISEYYSSL